VTFPPEKYIYIPFNKNVTYKKRLRNGSLFLYSNGGNYFFKSSIIKMEKYLCLQNNDQRGIS
jgi:hypothetical protein